MFVFFLLCSHGFATVVFQPQQTLVGNNGFGVSGACRCDFNGDRWSDCVIGAEFGNQVRVFYGNSSYVNANQSTISIYGENALDGFGSGPITCGDVNKDGFDEAIISARQYGDHAGRVYIFWGPSLKTNTTITGEVAGEQLGEAVLCATGAVFVSSNNGSGRIYGWANTTLSPRQQLLTSSANFTILGPTTFLTLFGTSMAYSDVTADKRADLIVSDPYGSGTATGAVYVFDYSVIWGSTRLLYYSSARSFLVGPAANSYFGASLVTADVNVDGTTDVVVGATGVTSSSGAVYVFYGSTSFPATGIASSVASFTFRGAATNGQFGSLLAVGNFDGDIAPDLVVASSADATAAAYVFLGRSTYVHRYQLSTTSSSADFVLPAPATHGTMFGQSFLSLGNFGPYPQLGMDAVIVGAKGYAYLSSQGAAVVFLASPCPVDFSCLSGCNNMPYSTAVVDYCDVCGGGNTCLTRDLASLNISVLPSSVLANAVNATFTIVTNLTDPRDQLSYTVLSGQATVVENILTLTATPQYLVTQASHEVTLVLQATDLIGVQTVRTLVIPVIDQPSAPSDVVFNASTQQGVPSFLPAGVVLGTLSLVDENYPAIDPLDLPILFSVDAQNCSVVVSGNLIVTSGSVDYRIASTCFLVVTGSNRGGNVTRQFTFPVLYKNLPPTAAFNGVSLPTNVELFEWQPIGSFIGTVDASDANANEAVTVSLAGSDGPLRIDAAGRLFTVSPFSYVVKASYTVAVNLTDNGTPPLSVLTVLTISIKRADTPPSDILFNGSPANQTIVIPHAAQAGYSVARITAIGQYEESLIFVMVQIIKVDRANGSESTNCSQSHPPLQIVNQTIVTTETFSLGCGEYLATVSYIDVAENPQGSFMNRTVCIRTDTSMSCSESESTQITTIPSGSELGSVTASAVPLIQPTAAPSEPSSVLLYLSVSAQSVVPGGFAALAATVLPLGSTASKSVDISLSFGGTALSRQDYMTSATKLSISAGYASSCLIITSLNPSSTKFLSVYATVIRNGTIASGPTFFGLTLLGTAITSTTSLSITPSVSPVVHPSPSSVPSHTTSVSRRSSASSTSSKSYSRSRSPTQTPTVGAMVNITCDALALSYGQIMTLKATLMTAPIPVDVTVNLSLGGAVRNVDFAVPSTTVVISAMQSIATLQFVSLYSTGSIMPPKSLVIFATGATHATISHSTYFRISLL